MPNTSTDNLVNLVKDHLLRSWTSRQVLLTTAHALRRRQPSRMRRKLPLDGNIREFLQDNFPPIQVEDNDLPLWARAAHQNGRAVILVNETLVKAVNDTVRGYDLSPSRLIFTSSSTIHLPTWCSC